MIQLIHPSVEGSWTELILVCPWCGLMTEAGGPPPPLSHRMVSDGEFYVTEGGGK